MTGAAALAAERAYDVHGVALSVCSEEPAVMDAVDERLRAFPRSDVAVRPADVRFEFRVRGTRRVSAPPGTGRPIYDTPYGQVFYFADGDVLYGELAGVRLHCAAGDGVARIEAATFGGRELYLATHPLMTIALMELLERRGRYSVHAACLARGDRGVLLAGPSGAGKSTLTVALAGAGLAFLSDDVIFLDPDPAGGVRVLGFADALGITEAGAHRFPHLSPTPPRDGFPKRLVRVEDALPGVVVAPSCEPRVLIFPRVARDEPSAIAPLDPKEALLALVPDVLLTQPAATQCHLGAIASLLAQVRTYELRSGSDLERAAQLVIDALAS